MWGYWLETCRVEDGHASFLASQCPFNRKYLLEFSKLRVSSFFGERSGPFASEA